MKLVFAVLLLSSPLAFAATAPKDMPECKDLVAQCEAPAAGFKVGGHTEGKTGVWVDCIGHRAHGKEVKGVTFTQEQAQACETALHAAHPAKK